MKSFVKFLLSVVVFLCVQNFIFAAKTLEQIAKENKNINNTKKQKLVYYNPLDAKHYVLLEQVIGVISPFKETEISSAELMKASKECIDLFNRAVETEKEPYIIQTPQKAVIAWTNVKENSKQNSFIKIADKRISEWNAASKTLENHEKSFQKVLKFAKGKAASAKQKKELMLNHLKEFGTAFGVQEILDIATLEKDDKITEDPVFTKTITTIRIQRCEKGVGFDCYECGLSAEDEKTQIFFMKKSCELKYKPACSKKNHIAKKENDESSKVEQQTKQRVIKVKKFDKLYDEVIGVIPAFVKENIDSDTLMKASEKSLSLLEDALQAENVPNVIQDQTDVIKCWEDVEKNQEENPFIEIAGNRLDEWANGNEKLIVHQESFQKVKQVVKNNNYTEKQKKNVMLIHLQEFGIEFGVTEILNIAEDARINKIIAEQDFQDVVYNIKIQRCEKGVGKDCFVDWSNKSFAKMSAKEAIDYCKELSNETTEWKVPTINELKTLIQNCANNSKKSCSKLGDREELWSSSREDNKCWYINFRNGDISKTQCNFLRKKHVRCIKNNQETQQH